MDPAAYTNPTGRLVKVSDSWAFVPNPIPRDLRPDGDIWRAEMAARDSLTRLQVLMQQDFNPYIATLALLDREAFFTSRMEGTYTTPVDLALFDTEDQSEANNRQTALEVSNYRRAFEQALAQVRDNKAPITHALIRKAHSALLRGVRKADAYRGNYREGQNHIGKTLDLQSARYIPPPKADMEVCMEDVVQYLRDGVVTDDGLPPIAAIGVAHYQFEAVHPFDDGNGRIGRLLIPLSLIAHGVIADPILHVSATMERHREQYLDSLLAVSQRGTWKEWIIFFLRMVKMASDDTAAMIERLRALMKSYRDMVQKPKMSPLLTRIVEGLFKRSVVTIRDVEREMAVSFSTASEHVQRLEGLGILEEITGKVKNRIYAARGIHSAVYE